VNNWAGNVTYSTERILRPRSAAEAQEMIADADTLHPLGTRHSFGVVADSAGALLSTEHLDRVVEIGDAAVRRGRYPLRRPQHRSARPGPAAEPRTLRTSRSAEQSQPDHGSGPLTSRRRRRSSVEVARADGSISRLGRATQISICRCEPRLGLVGRLLDVVPAFELRQYVRAASVVERRN
jgi:xylitol oxidase